MSRILSGIVVAVVLAFAVASAGTVASAGHATTVSSANGAANGASIPAPQLAAAPSFVLKWGTAGAGDGQFKTPLCIAADGDGNVYVTDSGNHRVQRFDRNGVYLGQFGTYGTGDGQLNGPRGVAFWEGSDAAPARYVYVVDSLGCRVEKFTPSGAFVSKWGSLGSEDGQFLVPSGIAVGPSGNVYVVDSGHERIEKFTPTGGFLGTWGSRGSGDGQFNSVQGIAVDSKERVYVTDSGYPSRVEVFSAGGQFLEKWVSYGSGSDSSFTAFGVAVDVGDNVYVTDGSNWQRVMKFTSAGTPLAQWSAHVAGDSYGADPKGIAVAQFGDVYVTDANNQCVKKYGAATPAADKVAPTTKAKGNDGTWHRKPVTLTFSATDNAGGSGVAYTEARLDDDLLPFMWGPWSKGSRFVVPAPAKTHSGDGERRVQFRSVDRAGNVERTRETIVRIDTRAPVVTVLPASATRGKRAVVKIKVVEALSPQIRIKGDVVNKRGKVVHTATSTWIRKTSALNGWSFTCQLKRGTYKTLITVFDRAGNGGEGESSLTVR